MSNRRTDNTAILNHEIISQRYFFPRTTSIARPFWVECQDARLACVYHRGKETDLTVVHFHGNGEVVSDYLDGFPEAIESMGCDCFLAEFRGYGASTGTPQLGKMFEDVEATIQSMAKPPEKLILFGRSVGSLFAIKAAQLFPGVAGLILESAIADPLERLLLRLRPEELGTTLPMLKAAVLQAVDIKQVMTSFKKPTLILHTQHDGLVDVSHAERLAEWSGGSTHLEIFRHGSHNDIMYINGPRYFQLVNDFITMLNSDQRS